MAVVRGSAVHGTRGYIVRAAALTVRPGYSQPAVDRAEPPPLAPTAPGNPASSFADPHFYYQRRYP